MSNMYLILLSILGWGVGAIFYKMANMHLHPLMVSMVITSVYVLATPIAFLFVKFDTSFNWTGVSYAVIGALCVAIASIASFYALRTGGAGEVTVLTSLYPGLTLLLSVIFLGEEMTLRKTAGIILALGSCYLFSKK